MFATLGLLLFGFGTFQFLFYSLVPVLMKLTSAVVFNLSLLTADIYTLLFGLFLFHYRVCVWHVLLIPHYPYPQYTPIPTVVFKDTS